MYVRASPQATYATNSGPGAFGIFAVYAANTQLEAVRKASEVTEEENAPELISQHTEDGTPLSIRLVIT